jgi:hypothetical protein
MRHPIQLPNYMACLVEFYSSLTLFYTQMSFKILKFSNRPLVFFPSNLLYRWLQWWHGISCVRLAFLLKPPFNQILAKLILCGWNVWFFKYSLFVCYHVYFLTPLPDCIVSTEWYMYIIFSAGHALPAEFGPEPTEGSHKSHASPVLPHPGHLVPSLLTTCQTTCPVKVWHIF